MLGVLLAFLAAFAPSEPDDEAQEFVAPEVLEKAFAKLEPAAQHEIVEWYRLETTQRAGLQQVLVRSMVEREARAADPGTYPALEPAPVYDPTVHAPKQPTERTLLDPNDKRVKSARTLFRGSSSSLERAFVYDWGTGEIRRSADGRDDERAFRNALYGFAPDLDLAEALLQARLDDGSEKLTLAAFGHAYVDREGRVYPGITLYDAWSSGESFETPDVDVLGLVHEIEDEWKRWRAPIGSGEQAKIYKHIGDDLFEPAHRHRGLREALARCYFVGDAQLDDGYAANLDRFHALWEFHEGSPEALRAKLPTAKTWKRFLDDWVKKTKGDKKLLAKGQNRRASLAADAAANYATLVRVMREYGALDK